MYSHQKSQSGTMFMAVLQEVTFLKDLKLAYSQIKGLLNLNCLIVVLMLVSTERDIY